MKLLCTGDLHIGRRPSRLPDRVDPRPLSSAEAWGRIVELALRERVDAVLLSGDVVDRANRFYEATGPLEAGIRSLARAGILTVAVAGNHDFDVLRWLVEGFGPDECRLLGRDGRWERTTLERRGMALHIDGWSFPEQHVREDPLRAYPAGADDGTPVVGLLHADVDQPGSVYAPVSLADLRRAGPGFWLLGHVHAPRHHATPGGAQVLYPGSPQAMDPGETGAHGVWLLEVGPGRAFACRQVPISKVRYDELTVDADGIEDGLGLGRRITDAVRAHAREVSVGAGPLRYLSCRIRLVGRTPLHGSLDAHLRDLVADFDLPVGEMRAFVERVEIATGPALDLVDVARGTDAAAALAALVHPADEADSEERKHLLRDAARQIYEIWRARPYRDLSGGDADEPDEAWVRDAVERQSLLLLDRMMSQKEDA